METDGFAHWQVLITFGKLHLRPFFLLTKAAPQLQRYHIMVCNDLWTVLSRSTVITLKVLCSSRIRACVYLNKLASSDLSGVVVVGESHAQLASVHLHSGLKT